MKNLFSSLFKSNVMTEEESKKAYNEAVERDKLKPKKKVLVGGAGTTEIFSIVQRGSGAITSRHIRQDMSKSVTELFNRDIDSEIAKLGIKLSNSSDVMDKAILAESLGFKFIPSAITKSEILGVTKSVQEEIDEYNKKLEYSRIYSLQYPRYKFIPTDIYNRVCEKYNLVTLFPSRYSKEVPTKNLKEMEEFISLYGTIDTVSTVSGWKSSNELGWELKVAYHEPKYLFRSKNSDLGKMKSLYRECTKKEFDSIDLNLYEVKLSTKEYYSVGKDYSHSTRMYNSDKTRLSKSTGLIISAPLSHFYYSDILDEEGKAIKQEILDPIVCRPVPGGMIVITAWDKEAEIPEIRNENWN